MQLCGVPAEMPDFGLRRGKDNISNTQTMSRGVGMFPANTFGRGRHPSEQINPKPTLEKAGWGG